MRASDSRRIDVPSILGAIEAPRACTGENTGGSAPACSTWDIVCSASSLSSREKISSMTLPRPKLASQILAGLPYLLDPIRLNEGKRKSWQREETKERDRGNYSLRRARPALPSDSGMGRSRNTALSSFPAHRFALW